MIHTKQECRIGDALKLAKEVPDGTIDTITTSPPYWSLRDYGVEGQIGLEPTLKEYHENLLEVTAELYRVLKPTGVMFWNHGDSYGGSGGDYNEGGLREGQAKVGKNGGLAKCMIMQNERLIIRMIDDQGWILRNRIIWNKPNGMPSSVTDRFSNKYEPVYMLTKSRRYWFDLDAVRVPFKDASEVQYRKKLRANKEYNVKEPYKANTPYKHNSARITSQESPNRMWADSKSLERQIAAGKNPGDVWDIKSPDDDWKQLLEVASELVGVENAIAIFESYMESRDIRSDVWTIPTQPYPENHFATFPTALVEKTIKAACPAEICPVCGMARERITEKEVEFTSESGKAGNSPKGKHEGSVQAESGTYDIRMGPNVMHHTTGWTSCDCNAGWIAGTVLDPFCGSGTVMEVCRLLNRNAIGLELNPDYEPLIKDRSMAHTPPLTSYFGGD